MRHLAGPDDRKSRWALALKERRGFNKEAVALAAKHARIPWALRAHDTDDQVAGA
jgi:transposase